MAYGFEETGRCIFQGGLYKMGNIVASHFNDF